VTESGEDRTRVWVDAWAAAAPVLQRTRDADIRASDTPSWILATNSLFREAVRRLPPEPTSGLIEQQRWFTLLRTG
jgi:hypothetical protein